MTLFVVFRRRWPSEHGGQTKGSRFTMSTLFLPSSALSRRTRRPNPVNSPLSHPRPTSLSYSFPDLLYPPILTPMRGGYCGSTEERLLSLRSGPPSSEIDVMRVNRKTPCAAPRSVNCSNDLSSSEMEGTPLMHRGARAVVAF